jgi:hydrogenase maturation protease
MNCAAVEKIANAVLYEGYILYPYRPSSLKNRQRFNFGVLYPPAYCEAQGGYENSSMQTECLVVGGPPAEIQVKVRFLQLIDRPEWAEGYEREILLPASRLGSIAAGPLCQRLAFAAVHPSDALNSIHIGLELTATRLEHEVFRIRLTVRNCAELDDAAPASRDQALLRSLISVHSVLQLSGASFASLIDPPEALRDEAAGCENLGTWPVLAGEQTRRDTMLAAPIILYDYPQIAPESPGDMYDGAEIDEILALRILTMTDEEKREVRSSDERARLILERTEMMPPEHFQKLHGAMRGLRHE